MLVCKSWLSITLCLSLLALIEARDFMETNPRKVNGKTVFQGDMLLSSKQWSDLKTRKAFDWEKYLWPEGDDGYPVVPYIFIDDELNEMAIQEGIEHWSSHTCITFKQFFNTFRTGRTTSNTDYLNQEHIRFTHDDGCWSFVGMQNQKGQNISIGSRCETLGTIAHEIGHAIGFVHEQSRSDRDDYVVINEADIDPEEIRNFQRFSTDVIHDHNVLYDLSSDMHYSSAAFTTSGKTTILTKDTLLQGIIGQRTGLSHRDKHLANIMYKCIDKWLVKCGESTDPCQNGGYYGADCGCVCAPGTSGDNCQTKTGGYYDSLMNPCTEVITEAGIITSPDYPNRYPAGQCVKHIVAPEGHYPVLDFTQFDLYGISLDCAAPVGCNWCCYKDALEIRTANLTAGNVYCGRDIVKGQSIRSDTRTMVLYFRAKSNQEHLGFSARLSFRSLIPDAV